MRIRLATVGLAAVGLLAGCADVVNGSGAVGGPAATGPSGSSASPDFPGQSQANSGAGSATTPAAPGTPTGTAAGADAVPARELRGGQAGLRLLRQQLRRPQLNGPVWPLRESKTVEAKTQWVVEEGAGHWGPPGADTLADIAKGVRQQMVDGGGYGDKPTVTTLADENTTVDGADAHLLHTRFTLDPTWAKSRGTAVKQEQLWILAIKVGPNDVSLWYTSVPDLVRSCGRGCPTSSSRSRSADRHGAADDRGRTV